MTILQSFWHYWKSFSVWFCTAFAVVFVIAAIVTYFKPSIQKDDRAAQCFEKNGTWDADAKICKTAA